MRTAKLSFLHCNSKMEMTMEVAVLLVAVLSLSGHAAATCQFSDVSTYTTTDKMMSSKTVLIAEFKAKCSSDAEAKFFAAVGDDVLPVVASTESNSYEVSWSGEHKAVKNGPYTVNILSEEGFAALRRAQRSGATSDVKPLKSITIEHPGLARTSLFIQTEFLAFISALLLWWGASSLKSKLSE
ncbi:translocon-associated protein subunit delta-like [Sycon ciliatum]|uniref:translocon-associated protein subunit delta-like n=1 Tax=Sycon ciliatum TaxID=27933 RepID=UPI0020A9B3F2|eukprot:scpid23515/ scgid6927/ Translocon-associated protein subunit delta; Signal sequence receptor subunit delta; Translocon-associated protein subunit delta; Signal sequence receptor subunit delta